MAALLLCGVGLAAPAAGGAGGERPRDTGAGSDDAAGLEDELRVGAAELAAVPAESRAVLAKVLGQLEGLRGELEELKAGKARSDEQAESLSARVAKLEENNCEDEPEEVPEEDELDDYSQLPLNSARRRVQAAPQACARVRDFQALSAAAMDACCPSNGGGHRRLQASCDLPPACPSAACAAVFVPYMQDCAAMLAATPGVPVADFESFAASCAEMQAGAGEMPVTVQMFRVLVNTEGAAQAGGMFPGGGGSVGAGGNLDPLQPLPPAPPPPPDASTSVTEYHAVCTSADVASCVPPCNAEHHGYELLATIDGTDTKFSCNLAHGLFSWMGAASEGGYLGADFASFFSAVVSGAAGSYIVTLTEDAGISTDLAIRPGQDVRIGGDRLLRSPPSWGMGSIEISQFASLSLSYLMLPGVINAALGATKLTVTDCILVGRDGQLHGHAVHGQANSPSHGKMNLCDVTATFAGTDFGGAGPGGDSHPDGRGLWSEGGRVSLINCTNLGGHIEASNNGSIALVGVRGLLPADEHGDNGVWFRAYYGGSISFSAMVVPAAVLAAVRINDGSGSVGSVLRLSEVTVPEFTFGSLTGTMTTDATGSQVEPVSWGALDPPVFTVWSGPCTTTAAGRCVGRPQGYGPSEVCTIGVSGGGGMLGRSLTGVCDVSGLAERDPITFQMIPADRITLPGGVLGNGCTRGALVSGDTVEWTSDGEDQGTNGRGGLPYSEHGLGGGWQICFA